MYYPGQSIFKIFDRQLDVFLKFLNVLNKKNLIYYRDKMDVHNFLNLSMLVKNNYMNTEFYKKNRCESH